MISKHFPDWCRSDVVVDTLLCFIPKVAQTTKIITEMEKNKIELSIKSLINCAFLVARKKTPSCVPGPLPLHDTNIFLSLSMWTSEGDLHSDHMPWRRLRPGLEATGPEALWADGAWPGAHVYVPSHWGSPGWKSITAHGHIPSAHTCTLTDKMHQRPNNHCNLINKIMIGGFNFQQLLNKWDKRSVQWSLSGKWLDCFMLGVLR